MQSKWIKPIGAAVLAAGFTFAYADTQANVPQPNRQEWRQRRFDRLAAHLNLTDAQKTQAKAIFNDAHQSAAQFAPELKQNRQALGAAIKANDTAEIDRLSAEQGRLIGRMTAIRTEAFAKIYQTLTPEQRAKADQLPQHFRSMMRQRMQNHQNHSQG
jgi:Spy/CpxP family protein refolding chaperone